MDVDLNQALTDWCTEHGDTFASDQIMYVGTADDDTPGQFEAIFKVAQVTLRESGALVDTVLRTMLSTLPAPEGFYINDVLLGDLHYVPNKLPQLIFTAAIQLERLDS